MEDAAEQRTVEEGVVQKDEGRHFLAVFFFSFMWGTFAVDRFYLGKIGTGILKLVTFGGFGVWVLVDLVLIMSGSMRDKQGRSMREYQHYKKFAAKTVLIFAVVLGITMLVSGGLIIYVVTQGITIFMQHNPSGGFMNLLPSTGTQLPTNIGL